MRLFSMSQKNRKTKVGATNQQYPLIQKKKKQLERKTGQIEEHS